MENKLNFDLISDFHVEMNFSWRPVSDSIGTPYNKVTIEERAANGDPFYYPWHLQKKSNILVMAGDTSNDVSQSMLVWEEAAKYYEQVIVVDGNHEHYNGIDTDINETKAKAFCHGKNITFLDGTNSFQYGDVAFIGACGWYDFKAADVYSREQQHQIWKQDSNDAKRIRFSSYPDKLAMIHSLNLLLQAEELEKDETIKQIIVVTHTVPTPKFLVPFGHSYYNLNGAYCNTAMNKVYALPKVKTWVFGHTHEFYDALLYDADCRFVSNPRGYRGEQRTKAFEGIKQIET